VDKTIYFTTDRRLIAAELETGRQLWTFSAKTKAQIKTYDLGDGCPNLWADDQHVYVVIEWDVVNGKERRLQALDRTTGREKWLLAVKGGNTDIQMIHDGLIYAGGYYSGLQVIDPARGKMLWSFNGANPSETARLISGNRIFIISGPGMTPGPGSVSQTNYLYAIDKPAKFRRQTNEP
jgi:outer membrane protein assembly factor BamB